MSNDTSADQYPAFNRIAEAEVGPITATKHLLENSVSFVSGLLRKKPVVKAEEKKEHISTMRTATPKEREAKTSLTQAIEATEKKRPLELPVVDLTRKQSVESATARDHGLAMIRYAEDGKTITGLGINLAGPEEAPKLVTLNPVEFARLKLALSFLENNVLATPVVALNPQAGFESQQHTAQP